MAYLEKTEDIYTLYETATTQAKVWRENYHEYERIADNELAEDLDESLPETNDGSLAASLYKLPKRVINSKSLQGRVRAVDTDDAWLTEIANIQLEKKIIPNASSQAPWIRKWKDAVRKAAIYGSVPLITLFVERGNYTGGDFIVAQPQDVTLEPGKVSDNDSDIMFWDVYFTDSQLDSIIDQAKSETKENLKTNEEGYNKWYISELEDIKSGKIKDDKPSDNEHRSKRDKSVEKGGYHFCIVLQRGVNAPFYMYHKSSKKKVREWTNPDPTGDLPIHFLYCYQDFINPYGIGIVKLAGGTQNVLDYMRQADVLATQIGLRPPILISGDVDSADIDSFIYAQDQPWIAGEARVQRQELSNQIYSQLPNRISMYKTSLNQLIPTGDTSISAEAGDPSYSKTPAGVKFQAASLSIDDEDFKDNLYMTYEAVVKSIINTHFANMNGSDLMKLSDEERDLLSKAGIEFPEDAEGNLSNELEFDWDELRAEFDFEIEPEQDKAKDEEKRLEGLLKVSEVIRDTNTVAMLQQGQPIILGDKKLNPGELFSEIISLTTDNDKILEDYEPEDQQELDENGNPIGSESENSETHMNTVQALMEHYGVTEDIAEAMLEAEKQGFPPEEIVKTAAKHMNMKELANAGQS